MCCSVEMRIVADRSCYCCCCCCCCRCPLGSAWDCCCRCDVDAAAADVAAVAAAQQLQQRVAAQATRDWDDAGTSVAVVVDNVADSVVAAAAVVADGSAAAVVAVAAAVADAAAAVVAAAFQFLSPWD